MNFASTGIYTVPVSLRSSSRTSLDNLDSSSNGSIQRCLGAGYGRIRTGKITLDISTVVSGGNGIYSRISTSESGVHSHKSSLDLITTSRRRRLASLDRLSDLLHAASGLLQARLHCLLHRCVLNLSRRCVDLFQAIDDAGARLIAGSLVLAGRNCCCRGACCEDESKDDLGEVHGAEMCSDYVLI